ncbi:MAG TPA: TonB-dependent receptor [Pyrinomonadaceae bacterium]|nr:TonB-dependent receptor [Pyrinomonadaceae bacterium]
MSGTVRDQNGAVIIKARVDLVDVASERIVTTETALSGKYEFAAVPPGTYLVSITREGFAIATARVIVQGNGSYSEDFALLPRLIESKIVVTASKGAARSTAETPQIVAATDASKIEQRRPWSTLRAIEKTPNLTPVIANPMLERPRLRGLASNRLLLVLDGERLNNVRSDPTSGVSPSTVDVTQLATAEVVSGAGSSLYGSDAMAGVINLITAAPPESDDELTRLGVCFNGEVRSNGPFRRAASTINWSRSNFALRMSGSLFRQSNYTAGNQSISLDEVLRFGNLATEMGNAIGNNVARTYAVWSMEAGAEIPNAQAHGFSDRLDLWFFPGTNQNLRYRQLNSQHANLGFSFITPPFDPRTQFNSFRRLDKYGVRYERRELTPWLHQLSAGGYYQKYSFPDDTITSSIPLGSSWILEPNPNDPQNLPAVLTGQRSTFIPANLSQNKNSIRTVFADAQATLAPFAGTLLTAGLGYLRESSVDQFSRTDLSPPFRTISNRASNPDSVYQNWSSFSLIEHEPSRWLKLTGGLRLDNWRTRARVTSRFPLGSEATLLELTLPDLFANPGAIDPDGAAGILDLVKGRKDVTTKRTVVTGNIGAVFRLPAGINSYFRWGHSYREPGITERYLLRDFGDPAFSVLVIPNVAIKPERGREIDVGVKLQRGAWSASAGYFVNDLKDFIGSSFGPLLFVTPDPARGLDPISPFFPFHGVLYVQRTNTARARISGFEGTYEASLQLGRAGVLRSFGMLGLLKGSNLSPDQNTLTLIDHFYNRPDTPIPLRGSATDAPLSSITPWRTINGVRFDSLGQRWFAEYELRQQGRVTRAEPLDLSAAISTEYGTIASLNSFSVQTLRSGYIIRRENYRIMFTMGLENLTNRLYFEHFQTAPAPGRSLVFGTTLEIFNLLERNR